mgnify:CR=1 FL=1
MSPSLCGVSVTVFVQHVSISVSGSILVAASIYCRWLTSLLSSTTLLAEVHCLAALFGLHTDDVRLPLWSLLSGHSGSPAPVRPLLTILWAPTVVRSVWPLRLLSVHSGLFGCYPVTPATLARCPAIPAFILTFSSVVFGVPISSYGSIVVPAVVITPFAFSIVVFVFRLFIR